MSQRQSDAMRSQYSPRGSSMFSRGRNQSFADNDISSSGRDLFIFNINSTGKREMPILEQVAAESEVEIPDLDSLGRTREDSIISEGAEKSSIFRQKQVQSMISFLLKPIGGRRRQAQSQFCLPDVEAADQYANSQPNHSQGDLKSPSNEKGKARATDADVEEMPIGELDPRVHVISTQDHRFLSVAGLTRHNVSSETYAIHMLPYRHGYPLWLPQPDMSLPIGYREVGIDIGDVGIITPDGGFDFLFNIWLPSSHPTNPRNLPPDFDVLPRPEKQTYREERLFNSFGNICCGAFNSNINHKACSLEFTCNKEEGSVLALPDGASREDLKNENCLEDFIKQSAESWYRYATGPGDRLLEYNSLYVVTGCMKTQSWGIATYSTVVPPPHNVIMLSKSTTGTSEPYIWEKQGGAIARTGPYPDRDLDNTVSRQNQCTFIRGYKVALSGAAWRAVKNARNLPVTINAPTPSSQIGNEPTLGNSPPSPPPNHGSGSSRWASNLPMRRTTDVTPRTSAWNVDILPMPVKSKVWHPLDALNDLLLERVPQARVALTHDSLWCDVVEKHGGAVLATTLDLLPFYTMKMYQPYLENDGATFILRTEHETEQGAKFAAASDSPPTPENLSTIPIGSAESLDKDIPPARRSMRGWLKDARLLIRNPLSAPIDRTPRRKPQGRQETSVLPDFESDEVTPLDLGSDESPPSPIPSNASGVVWLDEEYESRINRSNYRYGNYSHEFIDRSHFTSNRNRFRTYRYVAEKRFRNTARAVKNTVLRRRRSLSV